jgi:maltose O-acetyltransferase
MADPTAEPVTMREAMLAGEWYRVDDELNAMARRRYELEAVINDPASSYELVQATLAELIGTLGEGATIWPPFHCDYGTHLSIAAGSFVNVGGVFLDCAPITIGEAVQIGPNVQLLTPDHPRDPVQRRAGWEAAHPITIGDNAWLGGGVIVCPGVTIGEGAIVGAGAVVTKDVAPGRTVVGNPARPVGPR